MLKILIKAAILFFIVISIYLIVNPSACSNMMAGRERTLPAAADDAQWQHPMSEQPVYFSEDGTQLPPGTYVPADGAAPEGVFDTNTLHEEDVQPVYSQEDIDYAIASRYVELEREYARGGKDPGKDASREISFIVMDDFEMSPTEWEGFLSRATASGLFDRVRNEMPPLPPDPTAPAQ